MTTTDPVLVTLTADVHLTRLPYGGAVLVNGRTLDLAELTGVELTRLDDILAGRAPADSPLARRLFGDGWLTRKA